MNSHSNMKDETLQVRVSVEEKQMIEKAAQSEVLKPAQWIRQTLVKEARKLLRIV